MTVPQADQAMLYASYAQTCLKAAPLLPERNDRVALRQMAAEWLTLTEQTASRPAERRA